MLDQGTLKYGVHCTVGKLVPNIGFHVLGRCSNIEMPILFLCIFLLNCVGFMCYLENGSLLVQAL
ncbi:hypothetical protein ACJX0J_008466, partial [Zea mays]